MSALNSFFAITCSCGESFAIEVYNKEDVDKELERLDDIINNWEFNMAYFTCEDVATAEGVKEWVLNNLDKIHANREIKIGTKL